MGLKTLLHAHAVTSVAGVCNVPDISDVTGGMRGSGAM